MPPRRLRADEYTIAWICTLPIELSAAQLLLDEEHDNVPQGNSDTNIYTLGRILDHNVVIACQHPGSFGSSSLSVVATHLMVTFRSIRFGLLVGIGGGAPNESSDIRLGDVLIGQPQMGHGGVVQLDFGKWTSHGFGPTRVLNAPPKILLNTLAKLRSNHLRDKNRLSLYLASFSGRKEFSRGKEDLLFGPDYIHSHGRTCDSCDRSQLFKRPNRETELPVVHYGTIATGNFVMKDAKMRDEISEQLGRVLAFDMEAAGIVNILPCLVIRGICDYADSHKNRVWQGYAAATAAATAKELLSLTPKEEVAEVRDISGWTPMHHAAQSGNIATLEVLLEAQKNAGVDQDRATYEKNSIGTPLHVAARYTQKTAAELLLEKGADPNSRDGKGWTSLHHAACRGDLTIVKLLYRWGVDDSITNADGKTARTLAVEKGNRDVLEIMENPPVFISPKADEHGAVEDQQVQGRPQWEFRCQEVCEQFYPHIEFIYHEERNSVSKAVYYKSIFDAIYNEENFWETALQNFCNEAGVTRSKADKHLKKWIHLPANNVSYTTPFISYLLIVRPQILWVKVGLSHPSGK